MVLFLAKVKIFRFWPKTMDYNYSPGFFFLEVEKNCEKSIPSERERKEKSNGTCLSCVAPLSRELLAFKAFYSLYI